MIIKLICVNILVVYYIIDNYNRERADNNMENKISYSGLFIVTPEKEEAIDEIKGCITSIITENSGNIVKENMMGKRTLAYPIKKKATGIYYEVTFTAPPESVGDMMRLFRINTDILRTLIEKNV